MAFRASNIGNDTVIYISIFDRIDSFSFKEILSSTFMMDGRMDLEKGFLLFNKVVSLFTSSSVMYLTITSTIIILSVAIFFQRYSESSVLSLYLYTTIGVYFFMITGMRQALSMSICLFGVKYAEKRKLLRFLLIVFLAASFHKSAIVFLMVYWLVNLKLSKKNIWIWLATTVVSVVFLTKIQDFVNELLGYSYSIEETGNGYLFLAIMIVLLVLSLLQYKKTIEEKPETIVLFNMQFVCFIFWILRLFTRSMERPSYYFIFGVLAVIPTVINRFESKSKFIIIYAATVLFAILYFHRLNGNIIFVPYEFVQMN